MYTVFPRIFLQALVKFEEILNYHITLKQEDYYIKLYWIQNRLELTSSNKIYKNLTNY